jgi:hypothetical protein
MKPSLLFAGMVALLIGGTPGFADLIYTFATEPVSGDIQGLAGATIGWGYSITNEDTTHWLVPTNLTAGPFLNANADGSVFDFPNIGPGATVTLAFDAVANTGLYGLTWDAGAPPGFTNSGVFTLDSEWWTGNPSSGGAFFENAAEETAPFLATVGPNVSGVPEPSSYVLLLAALLALLLIHHRLRTAM